MIYFRSPTGRFCLDPHAGQLWLGEPSQEEVPLTAKPMEVLCYLAERPGQRVKREHLFQGVWEADGANVSNNSLDRAISSARAAIGDRGKPNKVISTITGLGFQFLNASIEAAPAFQSDSVRAKSTSVLHSSTLSPAQLILRSGQQVEGAFQVVAHLEPLILNSTVPIDLHVSAIYGDITEPFLRRMFEKYEVGRGRWPQLKRVVFKHPSQTLARKMMQSGQQREVFWSKLQFHLGQIEECLRKHDIPLIVGEWTSVPKFHGYVFGDKAFRGRWEQTESRRIGGKDPLIDTRTSMTYFTKQEHPEELAEMLREFEDCV